MPQTRFRLNPSQYIIDEDGERIPLSALSKAERDDLKFQQDMDDAGDLFASDGGGHE